MRITEPAGDRRAPVAALRREPRVAKHIMHQGGDTIRHFGHAEPPLAGLERQAIPRQGWRHHREGVARIAAEARRIGKARDDVEELEHRAGPAVQQQERHRIGADAGNVQVVQLDTVERDAELRKRIQRGFLAPASRTRRASIRRACENRRHRCHRPRLAGRRSGKRVRERRSRRSAMSASGMRRVNGVGLTGHDPAPASCRRCALRTYIALSASSSALPACACGPRIGNAGRRSRRRRVRPPKVKVKPVDGLFQRRRFRPRIGFAQVPQQHRELVAAEPPDHVGGAHLADSTAAIGLQHLVARGVPESIVDRFQAIDVEHDQRAAGMVALDVGDGAIEFALEAAPVRNVRAGSRYSAGACSSSIRFSACANCGPQPAYDRLGVIGAAGDWRAAGRTRAAGVLRNPALLRRFTALGAVAPVSSSWSSRRCLLKKACRKSPRQDSPFRTPCHALPNHGPVL